MIRMPFRSRIRISWMRCRTREIHRTELRSDGWCVAGSALEFFESLLPTSPPT